MGISRTAVVAVALGAVVLGDVAGVLHVSARERAEAAERRDAADAAWAAEVRVVAEQLLLARAPISDAGNHFAAGELSDAVRYDVYVRGAASTDLAVVRERLAGVQVPPTRRDTHARLTAQLDALSDAVDRLASDADGVIEAELVDFTEATAEWDRLIRSDVAEDLPAATTIGSEAPLTRAGQIFRWSSACAEASDDDESLLGQDSDVEQAAGEVELSAQRLDTLLTELLSVKPAEADVAEVQRDLEPALRGMRDSVTALRDLAAALRARDADKGAAALVLLDRVEPLSEAASRFFEGRGSTVCSDYFDPGLLRPGPPPSTDAART